MYANLSSCCLEITNVFLYLTKISKNVCVVFSWEKIQCCITSRLIIYFCCRSYDQAF